MGVGMCWLWGDTKSSFSSLLYPPPPKYTYTHIHPPPRHTPVTDIYLICTCIALSEKQQATSGENGLLLQVSCDLILTRMKEPHVGAGL